MSESDSLKDFRKVLGNVKDSSDKTRKDDETWRKTKDERDAKLMSLLTSLIADRDAEKKAVNAKSEEDKKKPPPTIQTVLDASKAKKEEDDKRMKDAIAGESRELRNARSIVLTIPLFYFAPVRDQEAERRVSEGCSRGDEEIRSFSSFAVV